MDFQSWIDKFVAILKENNSRYLSYEHCRNCFIENHAKKEPEKEVDYMTLQLYAYLASWGMLRNSFLMQKDYLFSSPIVRILCKPEYAPLIDFDPFQKDAEKQIGLMMRVRNEIKGYYLGKTIHDDSTGEQKKISNVTDTLVTKILLGTLGCTPAYDQYFVKALRSEGIVGTFSKKSIEQLIRFARDHEEEIKTSCSELGPLYPPMKVIDMYFWQKGIRSL